MSSEWEPGEYDSDPMVNAVLNVARELRGLSTATHQLLYGLKYSDERGMSIAEAIERASENIALAFPDHTQIVDAIDRAADAAEASREKTGER